MRLIKLSFIFCLLTLLGDGRVTNSLGSPPADKAMTLQAAAPQLALTPFASGLNSPVGVVGSADGRLFVLERKGVVRILLANGSVVPKPFIDISARVDASFVEEGLLGLAFHPEFVTNGYFYLNYVNTAGGTSRTRISRFTATDSRNVADPDSEEILLTIEQPYENHNGGHILFGPDGLLYIPLGDGGGGGDPGDRAQDVNTLLGKIVRIDVDSISTVPADCIGLGSGNYRIPEGNPMIDGAGGACDEIWDLGLRNPWRASFDREVGDLYLGDVGQASWEEIDLHPAQVPAGQNFGWRCYEGNHPFNTIGCGPAESYRPPIFEYNHEGNGCSIISGYVYRGRRYPDLYGHFFLTDYCSGIFWELAPDGAGGWNSTRHADLGAFGNVAFGEGCDGEVYLANIDNGVVYRLGNKSESAGPERAYVKADQPPNSIQLESWSYLPLLMSNVCS